MSEHSQLEKYIHDALTHLYDIPYLQAHPLTHWLGPTSGSDSPGRVLRRLLLETIQDLKPPPDTPLETAASIRYQVLYLRYVRGESIDDVARRLAIGERQLYRKQHEALGIVTTELIQRLRIALSEENLEPPTTDPAPEPIDRSSDSVRSEVDRLGSARSSVPIDLAHVLRGAVATVGSLTEADHRPIALQIAPSVGPVAADRVATRQALLGMLMFARNTCSEGGLVIDLEQSGGVAIARVRFRCSPGAHFENVLSRDSNLVVCRRLVELQGGVLTEHQSRETMEIAVRWPIAQPRVVLIVDDNTDTLGLFTRYLEEHAHRVVTATTGEDALRLAGEKQPDAVILDVMLPAADGYEALQALRSDPQTADVPVVVCTVLKQRDLALALGATDFVPKPATQGALLASLDRCWAGSRWTSSHQVSRR